MARAPTFWRAFFSLMKRVGHRWERSTSSSRQCTDSGGMTTVKLYAAHLGIWRVGWVPPPPLAPPFRFCANDDESRYLGDRVFEAMIPPQASRVATRPTGRTTPRASRCSTRPETASRCVEYFHILLENISVDALCFLKVLSDKILSLSTFKKPGASTGNYILHPNIEIFDAPARHFRPRRTPAGAQRGSPCRPCSYSYPRCLRRNLLILV
jgi:hypothetical protein